MGICLTTEYVYAKIVFVQIDYSTKILHDPRQQEQMRQLRLAKAAKTSANRQINWCLRTREVTGALISEAIAESCAWVSCLLFCSPHLCLVFLVEVLALTVSVILQEWRFLCSESCVCNKIAERPNKHLVFLFEHRDLALISGGTFPDLAMHCAN